MASKGNKRRRAATKPHNTKAKKGNVTHKTFNMGGIVAAIAHAPLCVRDKTPVPTIESSPLK
jgi:hypothetical protein